MKGIQGGSMYFYIDGFYARGEDPRNRVIADVYILVYQPSGRPGQIARNYCRQNHSKLTAGCIIHCCCILWHMPSNLLCYLCLACCVSKLQAAWSTNMSILF